MLSTRSPLAYVQDFRMALKGNWYGN